MPFFVSKFTTLTKGDTLTRLEEKARTFHEKHMEKHRNNKEATRKVDRMMAFIGVMGPLATLIQVVHIFATRNVGGISVYTWIGYMIVSTCWFVYGFFYKDKPIMIVNSLSFLVNSFIVAGFVMYH